MDLTRLKDLRRMPATRWTTLSAASVAVSLGAVAGVVSSGATAAAAARCTAHSHRHDCRTTAACSHIRHGRHGRACHEVGVVFAAANHCRGHHHHHRCITPTTPTTPTTTSTTTTTRSTPTTTTKTTPTTATRSTPTTTTKTTPSTTPAPAPAPVAARTTDCYAAPAACGYPAPGDGTTGVPSGTTLSPASGGTITTPGMVIRDENVTGSLDIEANNVTIEDSRVENTSTCGPTSTCGNSAIRIGEGVSGTTIDHVETTSAAGDTCEHDIRNTGDSHLVIESSYLHACDSNLYTVAPATIKDSYGIAKLAMSSDHVENIYSTDTTLVVDHDTLINPEQQTAVVFSNTNDGGGGACSNHDTIESSLLAGGGYTLYTCANASSAGSASNSVVDNRFARCLTAGVYFSDGGYTLCSKGPDASGVFPSSGDFGLADMDDATSYSGNVWDDNSQPVTP